MREFPARFRETGNSRAYGTRGKSVLFVTLFARDGKEGLALSARIFPLITVHDGEKQTERGAYGLAHSDKKRRRSEQDGGSLGFIAKSCKTNNALLVCPFRSTCYTPLDCHSRFFFSLSLSLSRPSPPHAECPIGDVHRYVQLARCSRSIMIITVLNGPPIYK